SGQDGILSYVWQPRLSAGEGDRAMNDFSWGLLLGFAAGVIASAGVYLLTHSRPKPRRQEETVHATALDAILESQDQEANLRENLRQNLRVKFMHDEEKINRAIEAERERAPNASEVELLQAAIYRWERDNR